MYFSATSNVSPNLSNISFLNKILIFITIITLGFIINDSAFASNTDDPLGDRLCSILKIVMGPTAKFFATCAIICVAVGLFTARINWLTATPFIVGIIIIFAAPNLVVFIGGSDNVQGGTECMSSGT